MIRGAAAKPRPILAIRDLTRDDLARLADPRTNVLAPTSLRDSHHRVARLVASGLRQFEVAAKTGYSIQRIGTLTASPAFRQLVAEYQALVTEAFVESQDDYFTVATSNMLKAERQIADKLDAADDAGETLPTRELVAISRDAADRFGYGKKLTNLNVNVDFASKLEKAIARSGKTIEATALPGSLVPPVRPMTVNPVPAPSSVPIRRRA